MPRKRLSAPGLRRAELEEGLSSKNRDSTKITRRNKRVFAMAVAVVVDRHNAYWFGNGIKIELRSRTNICRRDSVTVVPASIDYVKLNRRCAHTHKPVRFYACDFYVTRDARAWRIISNGPKQLSENVSEWSKSAGCPRYPILRGCVVVDASFLAVIYVTFF